MKQFLPNFRNYWRLLPTLLVFLLYSFNGQGQTALIENFDGGVLPTGWVTNGKLDGTGTKKWLFVKTNGNCTTADHTSGIGYYALSDSYNVNASESPVNLITPTIDLSSASYQLEFYAWVGGTAPTDPIVVDVSTDDGSSWNSAVYTVTKTVTGSWVKHTVSLTSYNTSTVKIKFRGIGNYGMGLNNSGIDDIKVFVPQANDLSAKSLSLSPSTLTDGISSTITADIENVGINAQSDVLVTFKDGATEIGTATIASIAAGEVKQVQQTWPATEGVHNITAEVASDGDNSNNLISKTITVYPAGALIESFEGTFAPTGWSGDISSSNWQKVNYDKYDGSYTAYMSGATGKRLITPKVSIGSTSSLSYYTKTTSSYGTAKIKVQYSADKITWTDAVSFYTLTTSWSNQVVNLSSIPTGNYYLCFFYEASYVSACVDMVVGPAIAVEAPAPAITPNPANAATGINTSATMSWLLNGSGGIPTGYKIYFGTDGAGSATPTSIVNGTLQTGTTYTPLTPLAYSTIYYWQIVPTNSVGDATSCPIWSFITMADPTQPLPYSQNFESGTTPNAWTISNFSVQSYGVEASKSLSVDMSYTSTASATTCPIGPAVASTQLSFDYRFCVPTYSGYPQQGYALTASDKIDVKVSTDGGTNYTTVYTINQATHTTATEFATKYISLDATYDTKNLIVKLEATKGGTAFQVDIDNLLVRETPTIPICSLNKTSIDFNYQAVGIEPYSVIKITNTGGGSLNINSGDITITGANADEFAIVDPGFPISLGVGATKNITIKFVAITGGVKSANLNIAHNAVGSPELINLAGEAYMPFASFTEGFETTLIDETPKGWVANFTGYAWCGVATSAPAAHSGTNSMTLAKYGSDLVTLVTPAVSNFSTNRLKFWAKSSASATSLSIGTITDPSDSGTYTEFQNVPLTTTYAEYIIDFSTYSGTDKFLAIKTPSSGSNTTQNVDDVVWEAIPTTPLLGISSTSIDFSLVAAKNTKNLNLVVSNAGIGTLTINATDLVLSGANASEFKLGSTVFPLNLAANSTANVELVFQPQTAGDKTATLTISHNGTNPSGVVVLSGKALPKGSLIETFNATTFPSTGWTAQTGWVRQTFAAYEGAGHAYISPSSTATDVKLITPELVIASGDVISFYTKTTASSPYPTIKVMYSTSTSGPWTQIGTTITLGSAYTLNQIDLTSIAGNNYYIAFAVSSASFKSTYLDMVTGPVVYEANVAPEFTSTANTEGKVGQSYIYNITTTDSNDDDLVITAPTKPSWLNITDNGDGTATLSGTPTTDGDYNVSLTVTDGTESVNQDFTITVAPETTYIISFSVVGSNGTLDATVDAAAITSGDQVIEGKDVVFTASPATGYRVKEWMLNSVAVSGNTTNSYTLTNHTAAAIVTVEFEVIPATTYTVNYSVVSSNGMLDATVDAVAITSGDQVIEGKDVVFTASPANGYMVKEWMLNSVAVFGNTTNSYTLTNLTAAAVVTVEFEVIPATTYTVNYGVVSSNGMIDATVDAVAITSGDQVIEGKDVVFNAAPATGYRVKEWTMNSVVISGNTSNNYTLTNLTTTVNITVEFEVIPNNDATLSDLQVDGTIIAGFNASVISYNVELAFGTTIVPNVTATSTDANADVVVTPATALPGSSSVLVTAEDGIATKSYTVSFTIATGIDFSIEQNFNIYPIPSNGKITVDLGYNIQNNGTWTLNNLSGQVIMHGVISQPRFEITNYSKGFYILTIRIDQQTVTKKVVIE